MRKTILFVVTAASMSACLILAACQKSNETKSVKAANGVVKKQASETQPGNQVPQAVALSQTGSPLSDQEQKEFEKIGGALASPNAFNSEKKAIEYLKILLKGDYQNIDWYKTNIPTEAERKKTYSEDIATALSAINIRSNKEGLSLAIEIMKAKSEYPEAVAEAAKAVKFTHDRSMLPLLREMIKHRDPVVRLEAAGSLLSLGDSDDALPILGALTEKEGYVQSLFYLFKDKGKIIDERGYKIVEKALINQSAGVRIASVRILLDSKKITKDKAEEIAFAIVDMFKDKTEKDYGIGRQKVSNETYSEPYVLPGYKNINMKVLETALHSDGRACDRAMSILGELKSRKAIPVLKYIKDNNTNVGYVCWENRAERTAEYALDKILNAGGSK